MKQACSLALEAERKRYIDISDAISFESGFEWGQRYAEYLRWFKDEYWGDYIKQETHEYEEQRRTT